MLKLTDNIFLNKEAIISVTIDQKKYREYDEIFITIDKSKVTILIKSIRIVPE